MNKISTAFFFFRLSYVHNRLIAKLNTDIINIYFWIDSANKITFIPLRLHWAILYGKIILSSSPNAMMNHQETGLLWILSSFVFFIPSAYSFLVYWGIDVHISTFFNNSPSKQRIAPDNWLRMASQLIDEVSVNKIGYDYNSTLSRKFIFFRSIRYLLTYFELPLYLCINA